MASDPGRLAKIFDPPGDTRRRVSPTTQFPHSCIGQLECTFGPNRTYLGTGILIDERHVVTCAHNLYDNVDRTLVKAVRFACALDADRYPYGQWIGASGVSVPQEYRLANPPNPNDPNFDSTEITPYLYDYGLVRLAKAVNNGVNGYPFLYAASDGDFAAVSNRNAISGYPGDKESGTMWSASGPVICTEDGEFLFHKIATSNGQSGASIISPFPGTPASMASIGGIHVAGSVLLGTNWAVRVTPDVVNWFEGQLR